MGQHMQTKITILFFALLSILLILITLLFTAKPLYLAKAERQRIANIQKVYHKNYFRKRNKHSPKRSILLAQFEIDTILGDNPIKFETQSCSLEGNQSRENFKILTKIIEVINNLKDKSIIQISTYTDKKGSKKENLRVSQQRADILKEYINSRTNILFISAIGYGGEIEGKRDKKEREKKYIEINLKRIK